MAATAISLLVVSGAGGADAQTPRPGGTVVFGPVAEFACLNPLREDCSGALQYFWMLDKVLPGAYARAPDFTRRPKLVSGVTVTTRPRFTLTYSIRPDARWSDGLPVTARDFEFTYRAIRDQRDSADPHNAYIRSVQRIGSKTVRVVLRERYAGWRDLFSFVLPQHALAGEDLAQIWAEGMENPKTGKPIGSGPFVVGGRVRGQQLTLVRNPKYWGSHKAYLDRLVIRFCRAACLSPPTAEVLEGLETGAVDFAYARDAEIVPELGRIPGTIWRLHRTNGYEHLDFNLRSGHPALRGNTTTGKLVRQAFAYSIDRAELVRRLWGETYKPLHSAVLLGSDRHYAPNWNGYAHKPELARRLLRRAGCLRGADGIYACDGVRLSFRFSTLPTTPRQRGLELMQSELRSVGIEVVPSYNRRLFDQIDARDFDVVSFGWAGFSGFDQKDLYGCGASNNVTGYCQRLVTADLDQADRILDAAQRVRVLNRVDRQLARDVPMIPLYQIPWVYAYKDSIRDVIPSPDNLFWNAEDWWLDD